MCPMHLANLADGAPCTSAADCELYANCPNRCRVDLVEARSRPDMGKDQHGLFCCHALGIPESVFVASFGPVRTVGEQGRARARAAGVAVQVVRGCTHPDARQWARKSVLLMPARGWRRHGHLGPLVNHTCCATHANCEYVPSEDEGGGRASTVWVRTTRRVHLDEELCCDYGGAFDFLKHGHCKCCWCRGLTTTCLPSKGAQ